MLFTRVRLLEEQKKKNAKVASRPRTMASAQCDNVIFTRTSFLFGYSEVYGLPPTPFCNKNCGPPLCGTYLDRLRVRLSLLLGGE